MTTVVFSFDPSCPWTWRTSRWLLRVAPARDLRVRWSPMSLAVINEGNIPEEKRVRRETAHAALRLVAALAAEGRHDEIGRFYTEIGERVHERGHDLEPGLLKEAADAAALGDLLGYLDDVSYDAAVRAATEAALADAGPGVGSPVLHIDGVERGMYGPIIAAGIDDEEALSMWDALALLMPMQQFFEVKRGRR